MGSIPATGKSQTFAYFKMATDYTAALDLVDYFQDCQNGGEILDTIDAVFVTAEDSWLTVTRPLLRGLFYAII